MDSGAPDDPVLQEMVMYRHDIKARFCIETSARHFPGWLNVCTDHLIHKYRLCKGRTSRTNLDDDVLVESRCICRIGVFVS